MAPIRGPDGQFVSVPDSMPEEYRPDTPGGAMHAYLDVGDAREIADKIGGNVKTVKRNGRVEHHVRKNSSRREGPVKITAEVTCACDVEDFI